MALPAFDYGEDCRDSVRDLVCTVAAELTQEYGVTVSVGEWGTTQRTHFPLPFTVNGTDHTIRVSFQSLRYYDVDQRRAADGDDEGFSCVMRMEWDILRRQMREAVERQLGMQTEG